MLIQRLFVHSFLNEHNLVVQNQQNCSEMFDYATRSGAGNKSAPENGQTRRKEEKEEVKYYEHFGEGQLNAVKNFL